MGQEGKALASKKEGLVNIGAIYVYDDPATGKHMYVGSVQNYRRLDGRHKGHSKHSDRLGVWLQSFPKGHEPKPRMIAVLEWDDTWFLFSVEWFYQLTFETRIAIGGFNIADPVGPDHAAMGREGGKKAGAHQQKDSDGKSICAKKASAASHVKKDSDGKSVGAKNGAAATHRQKDAEGRSIAAKNCGAAARENTKKFYREHPGFAAARCRVNLCLRWNIHRGKPCTCGKHQDQTLVDTGLSTLILSD